MIIRLQNKNHQFLEHPLNNVKSALSVIETQDNFEYTNCVKTIHDQLVQLTSKRRKYDMNTLLNAYTIYIQSSKTYDLIRDSKMLILPDPVHLRRIANYQDLNPNKKSSNLNYIRKVAANLNEQEKYVVIQIYEIYSNEKNLIFVSCNETKKRLFKKARPAPTPFEIFFSSYH